MKKRNTGAVIITGFVITGIIVLIGIGLFMNSRLLGSMNHVYTEPESGDSRISLQGVEGDRIKFIVTSEVESGELNIQLYDSSGNAVYQLEHGSNLKSYFTLKETDTYTLTAEKSNFVGKLKVRVYKAE